MLTYPFTLPTGKLVELREMTGVEEELLTNPRLLRSGAAVNQVLRNVTISLDGNTDPSVTDMLDMLSGDRLFILIRARQISLGDDATVEVPCNNPQCGRKNTTTVNLNELQVMSYPDEREFTLTTTTGRVFVYGYLDGHMEMRLAQMPQEDVNIGTGMLMRIRTMDGQAPSKKTFASLTMKERNELRQDMLRVDGGIKTVIELVCAECGQTLSTRLEGNPSFFFPGTR